MMELTRAVMMSDGRIDRDEFQAIVSPFLARSHSIYAVEWVPRVLDSQRAEFEAAARSRGLAGFRDYGGGRPGQSAAAARATSISPSTSSARNPRTRRSSVTTSARSPRVWNRSAWRATRARPSPAGESRWCMTRSRRAVFWSASPFTRRTSPLSTSGGPPQQFHGLHPGGLPARGHDRSGRRGASARGHRRRTSMTPRMRGAGSSTFTLRGPARPLTAAADAQPALDPGLPALHGAARAWRDTPGRSSARRRPSSKLPIGRGGRPRSWRSAWRSRPCWRAICCRASVIRRNWKRRSASRRPTFALPRRRSFAGW